MQNYKVLQCTEYMIKFIEDQIQEHKKTFDPTNIRDFVDLHIESEMKEEQSTNQEKASGEVSIH